MAEKYRILIVEDEPLIAEDLAGFLIDYGFELAGIAHDYESAISLLSSETIHAAVLDVNLEDDKDGIDVAEYIRGHFDLPFIFLTSYSAKSIIDRAKETNPDGYLLKPFEGNDVMASLEIAIHNHLSKKPTELAIEKVNQSVPVALSQREYDLLLHLRQGKTNKEIADSMSVSVNTVKTHLLHLFEKLDVSNRTQAIFRILEFVS